MPEILIRRPKRAQRKARQAQTDRLAQLRALCAPALRSPCTLEAHLAALVRWRDVDAFCAFLWPHEARQVHSVIAREEDEITAAAWAERVRHVAALLREDHR